MSVALLTVCENTAKEKLLNRLKSFLQTTKNMKKVKLEDYFTDKELFWGEKMAA